MKKLAFSLVAFGATIVMSCGGGNSAQREQEVRDSLRQDSIKKVEAFNDSIRRDSIAKDSIRQDSMWRYRVTPDLATFDLRGPVKSVNAQNSNNVMEHRHSLCFNVSFSEKGDALKVSDGYDNFSIKRDALGRIKSLNTYYTTTFSYNEQGFPIKKYLEECTESYFNDVISYEYNSDGSLLKETMKGKDIGSGYNSASTYKIEKVDEFGNWTKRLRTVTYYYESFYDEPDPISRGTKTITETRTITYYSKK